MRRISAFAATVIVGAACATLGAARPGAAHAEGRGFVGCYGFGRVTMSPGITTSPRDGTFRSHPSACTSDGVTEATSYEGVGVSPG